jgi:hypothetical protein
MKKQSFFLGLLVAGIFFLVFGGSAMGYSSGTSYTWNSSTPNYNASANIHEGTIDTDTLTAGDFLGRPGGEECGLDPDALNHNAGFYGDSGDSVGWDDDWAGSVGDANTNGDAWDGLWVQIYSDGGWWDLGAAFDSFAVITSQDHGPYLAEGLEYKVFGYNLESEEWSAATISDIYLDGWRAHNPDEDYNDNGWLSDDITAVFQFDDGGAYQYIWLGAWAESGSLNEPEVDNIAGVGPEPGDVPAVPEPSTILLMGIGLLGLVGYSRKRFPKS